jgi:rhomboid family GlyGly-CTERM serine protease
LAERASASGTLAWSALTALLCAGAVLAWSAEHSSLDWQPALALHEPWRAFSAAFVHYSSLHLSANIAGALLVGALGYVAAVPMRSALAWLIAWPVTHFGLLLQPELLHYGGLSGVLHAGVAVACVNLIVVGNRRQRIVAALLLAGLALKVLGETPWQGSLRHPPGWDIAVAPFAHASGVVMGILGAAVGEAWHRRRAHRIAPHD